MPCCCCCTHSLPPFRMLTNISSRVLSARSRPPAMRLVAMAPNRQTPAPTKAAPAKEPKAPKAPKEPKEKELKRAPSAFNLFYKAKYQEVRAALTAKGSPAGLPECNQELRGQWSTMQANQKAPYEAEAAKAKEKVEAYRAANKKPTRPANAYAMFLKAEFPAFKAKNPQAKVTEIAKLVADKWKNLPANEKDAYKAKAASAASAVKAATPAVKAATPAPTQAPAQAKPAAKAATPAPAASGNGVVMPRAGTPINQQTRGSASPAQTSRMRGGTPAVRRPTPPRSM